MRNISLLKKFSLVLFISLLLFGFILGKVINTSLRQNMITRSNEITTHFLKHEIYQHLASAQLSSGDSHECYRELSRHLTDMSLGTNVKILNIKIWNDAGKIIWCANKNYEGQNKEGSREFKAAVAGLSGPGSGNDHKQKVRFADYAGAGDMMELFIPARLGPQNNEELVFEVYVSLDKLMTDIEYHNHIVWLSLLVGSVFLFVLLFGLFLEASRRIELQNREIQRSEERFRNLVETAQEGIISADKSGRILLMNETAELIFGYAHEETGTMHFSRLFVPDRNQDLQESLDRFFVEKNCPDIGKNFESAGIRKDGEVFPLEVSLSVSQDQDNCIITGLIRDITQRNQLYNQLEAAKEEWEECFDIINDAITIHDNMFNIIRANNAAEIMLGRPMETILSQKCFQSYHGQSGPPMVCPSCETLKTGVASTTEVYEPHLKKHLEVKALPRFDEAGQVIGVVHVVRDITDRKIAEEKQSKLQAQLNQVQKMESIGRLAGGIAHDFNNILSAIIGYSELVLRDLPHGGKTARDVQTIKDAGEKAASLTSQLLAFSRKQVLNMRPLDLNMVIEDLTKILARVIGEDIVLDLHLSPKIGVVVGDAGQIEQVLLNLAVNARDAMPRGGHFIIETSMVNIEEDYVDHHADAHLGPHVLLACTDTGVGIETAVREQIFDPFFTTKEVGKGTGLGLATVYGIVKQHGGQVYVYSELDKGTTFKIYLPISSSEVAEASVSEVEPVPTGTETILLTEDDRSVREMVKTFLEPTGYTVLAAENGQEALELSRLYKENIDLLLTDVIMPGMNGQELADILSKKRPDIKVVFMSGYTDDVIAHHGLADKDIHFIQKPITLSRLAKKLREVLNKDKA